jgi:hypothetical protein
LRQPLCRICAIFMPKRMEMDGYTSNGKNCVNDVSDCIYRYFADFSGEVEKAPFRLRSPSLYPVELRAQFQTTSLLYQNIRFSQLIVISYFCRPI